MNRLFKYIGLGICATFAFLSCEEEVTKPLDSAVITESVKILMADEVRAKIYIANDSEVLPMVVGESITMGYEATPEDVTYPNMVWSSTDNSVVSVDQNGRITAVAAGNAVVTIATEAMNVVANASVMINVVETVTKVSSIAISDNSERVDETYGLPSCYTGETMQLTATVTPADATYKTVLWSSSDSETASIDPITGLVTGLKMGKVTLTATALDTDKVTASHEIYIDKIINPIGIKLTNAPAATDIFTLSDTGFSVEFETYPAISTRSLITWTSSDETIATVSKGVVTFKCFGNVTITATCMEPGENDPTDMQAGFAKTVSFDINIPAGYYNEHFLPTNGNWWLIDTNGAVRSDIMTNEKGENYIKITPNTGSKFRGDFKRAATTATETYISAGTYPIITMRMDSPKTLGATGFTYAYDVNNGYVWGSGDTSRKWWGRFGGGGSGKWKNEYLLGDGSTIYVFDMSTQSMQNGGNLPLDGVAAFPNFKIVLADIAGIATVEEAAYRVFWFHTFKNMAEFEAYMAEWSEKTGWSCEKVK